MFIEPNTTIYILQNVPFERDYEHAVAFPSASAQANTMQGFRKYTVTKSTYQRVNRGSMRVPFKADDLYNCNYLMFQNTSFGTKWFYAFITAVNYINNEVSEIQYSLDVLNSWLFDFTLGECFIDRQHSTTDVAGDNLVPENVDLGDEYVITSERDTHSTTSTDTRILLYVSMTSDGEPLDGYSKTNNFLTPFKIYQIPTADPSILHNILSPYIQKGKTDGIVAMYVTPAFLSETGESNLYSQDIEIPRPTSINGYVPKNKKLYTYPYCYLYADNNQGQTAVYRWEDWASNLNPKFRELGAVVPQPELFLEPLLYQSDPEYYSGGLYINSFPTLPWLASAYNEYMNANRNQMTVAGISAVLSATVGAVTGLGNMAEGAMSIYDGNSVAGGREMLSGATGTANSLISGGSKVAMLMAKQKDLKEVPPQVKGRAGGSAIAYNKEKLGFTIYGQSIKRQFAERIDGYFTRFGYAQKKLDTPNLTARPHWTYIKTADCNLHGSIPADDITAIKNIFNSGITFWRSIQNVGNFSLDNTI